MHFGKFNARKIHYHSIIRDVSIVYIKKIEISSINEAMSPFVKGNISKDLKYLGDIKCSDDDD
jgi:hypothetical protein